MRQFRQVLRIAGMNHRLEMPISLHSQEEAAEWLFQKVPRDLDTPDSLQRQWSKTGTFEMQFIQPMHADDSQPTCGFSSLTVQEPGEALSKISVLQCFIHLMNPTRTLTTNWAQRYSFFSLLFPITYEDCGSAKYYIQSSWILQECLNTFCVVFTLLYSSSSPAASVSQDSFLPTRDLRNHTLSAAISISSLILSSCMSWFSFQLHCSSTLYLTGLHSLSFSGLFHFDPVVGLSKLISVYLFYFLLSSCTSCH